MFSKLKSKPILSLCLMNGILGSISDILAQSIMQKTADTNHHDKLRLIEDIDKKRVFYFASFQVAIAPVSYNWFKFLQRFRIPLNIIVDQIVFAPCAMLCFFSYMNLFDSECDLKHKLSTTYFKALKSNWCVWPLVQAINFSLVPLFYRTPFVAGVGIFWNSYLSYLNSNTDNNK